MIRHNATLIGGVIGTEEQYLEKMTGDDRALDFLSKIETDL